MRESGANPEHCQNAVRRETAVYDVSRSLGKPEKAKQQTRNDRFTPLSRKTYDVRK